MTRPPRIGVTTYREPATWGVWSEPADVLHASYARSVEAAGGLPMLLPPITVNTDEAAAVALDGLHGLILTGGADIDPGRYGADRDERTGEPRPDRDAWESALVHAAVSRGLPTLGICRGMQMVAVALGGRLVQHLPDVVGDASHCPTIGRHGRHDVSLAAGSRIAELLGSRVAVATYHHQAVDALPAGLVPTGWAEDGTIEAFEHSTTSWLVGVQWHPEVADGAELFSGFVDVCRSWRDAPLARPGGTR
jgi:putative glutamine amidotransferase